MVVRLEASAKVKSEIREESTASPLDVGSRPASRSKKFFETFLIRNKQALVGEGTPFTIAP